VRVYVGTRDILVEADLQQGQDQLAVWQFRLDLSPAAVDAAVAAVSVTGTDSNC
jgi:hypothetical protein